MTVAIPLAELSLHALPYMSLLVQDKGVNCTSDAKDLCGGDRERQTSPIIYHHRPIIAKRAKSKAIMQVLPIVAWIITLML